MEEVTETKAEINPPAPATPATPSFTVVPPRSVKTRKVPLLIRLGLLLVCLLAACVVGAGLAYLVLLPQLNRTTNTPQPEPTVTPTPEASSTPLPSSTPLTTTSPAIQQVTKTSSQFGITYQMSKYFYVNEVEGYLEIQGEDQGQYERGSYAITISKESVATIVAEMAAAGASESATTEKVTVAGTAYATRALGNGESVGGGQTVVSYRIFSVKSNFTVVITKKIESQLGGQNKVFAEPTQADLASGLALLASIKFN